MKVKTAQKEPGRTGGRNYLNDLDQIPQLSRAERGSLKEVTERFAFRSTEYYLSLIDWNEPKDPIRRLVIPNQRELTYWGDADPSNENSVTVRRGIQHKYSDTVLLLVTETCGGFCRYCFRKRIFSRNNHEINLNVEAGIDYIRDHPEVNNVLVTGGDPMMMSTASIEKLLKSLRDIEHVKIIRIGTKLPAFNPYRFLDDPELIATLNHYSLPDRRIYLMCHFDHPRELTDQAVEAVNLIRNAGVMCVNQNPVIRGVSDRPDVMAELWNKLSYIGVPQYYVFQNRPATGNRPFQVPIVEAYFAIEEAKKSCSGLGKRMRYVLSHESGKIEVLAVDDNYIYLKYHRAKRDEDSQRLVVCHRDNNAYWFDQLQQTGLIHLAI